MSLEKILRSVVIAGLFVVPIVPLFIANTMFFPFITGKGFLFRIVISIVFALWISLCFLDKKYLPKISPLSIAVFSFILIIAVADIFGISFYKSFWSNFERMEGLITILHLGAFFFVAGSIFDEKLWKRFFITSLAVSIIISFYSLLQFFGKIEIKQGGVRVDGTMGNAIYLALYLMFHVFISIFYFFRNKSKVKFVYLLIVVFELFIIYLSASRGVILGLIGGLLLTSFLMFFLEREKRSLKKVAGSALLIILVLIGGFWAIKDTSFVKKNPTLQRFSELSLDSIKTQGRYFVWPMALKGIKERPILGYGQENFSYVFAKHYDPRAYNQEPWFDRVHNTFLDWFIAGGILGFVAYIFILFSLFFALWKSSLSKTDKSIITGLFSAYIFQSLFAFDNLTSYIMFFAFLAFIWQFDKSIKELKLPDVQPKAVSNIILPLVVIMMSFFIYFSSVKPIMANKNLLSAIHFDKSYEESLNSFEKVFELNTLGNVEALIQLFARTHQVFSDPNTSSELREDYLNLTNSSSENLTNIFSEDARLLSITGSFYSNLGDVLRKQSNFEKAEESYNTAMVYLEMAKELAPNKQNIYFEIGSIMFVRGETNEALDTFKYAYELEPSNIEGGISYALALMGSEKLEEAFILLDEIGDSAYFDDRIINTLVQVKRFDKVLEGWQKRVEQNPENITYRQSLVAAYLILGQDENAIEELNKIIEIDPSFKETGEIAIKEIKAGRGKSLID